jgi:hypothetical protein
MAYQEVKNINYSCEFCDKSFASAYNLKVHKKTAKFCLQLQNKDVEETYDCNFCNKSFNVKSAYTLHVTNCKEKKVKTQEEKMKELEERNKQLEKELKQKEKQINELKTKLSLKDGVNKTLQKTNKVLLNKPSVVNNNTTNNNSQYNIQFNELFEKINILNQGNVTERINELNTKEITDRYNFGNFGNEFLSNLSNALKDLSFCTDISRKILVYKDENSNSVRIPANEFIVKCIELGNESIKDHFTLTEQIVDDKINNFDPNLTSEMLDIFEEDVKRFKECFLLSKQGEKLSTTDDNNNPINKLIFLCVKESSKLNKNQNQIQIQS